MQYKPLSYVPPCLTILVFNDSNIMCMSEICLDGSTLAHNHFQCQHWLDMCSMSWNNLLVYHSVVENEWTLANGI